MKLHEILSEVTIPMDGETPLDDMQSRDQEDSMAAPMDKVRDEMEKRGKTPRKNSNLANAKRIRGLAHMLKRSSNPEQEETPHQAPLGGHGSVFLHR